MTSLTQGTTAGSDDPRASRSGTATDLDEYFRPPPSLSSGTTVSTWRVPGKPQRGRFGSTVRPRMEIGRSIISTLSAAFGEVDQTFMIQIEATLKPFVVWNGLAPLFHTR